MEKYELVNMFNDTLSKCEDWMLDGAVNRYYDENYFNVDSLRVGSLKKLPNIRVTRQTTVRAILENNHKVFGVLNFASAKHPGGGAHKGSVAQEESIARVSTLVPVIRKCTQFYENPTAPLYSDRIIYSMPIYVIKNDNNIDVDPVECEIITCAAPNYNGGELFNISLHFKTMQRRFSKVLMSAIVNNQRNLILGAWGCGVFKNPPEINAQIFRDVLSMYADFFDEVIFAIPDDKSTIFKNILK